MLFVSIVVSIEINRRHYFRSGPRSYIRAALLYLIPNSPECNEENQDTLKPDQGSSGISPESKNSILTAVSHAT